MLGPLLLSGGRRLGFPAQDAADSFRPSDLAGLSYWFDAQDAATLFQNDALTTPVTADGQTVGGWIDKAAGRNAIQPTGTLRPLYRASYIHGRPAVEADGVDDFLRNTAFNLSQPMTIYLVAALATVTPSDFWIDGANGASDRVRVLTSAGSTYSANAGTAIADGMCDTNPHVHTVIVNSTASYYYIDGVLGTGPGSAGTSMLSGLTLFASRTGTGVQTGGIGELLIYSGAHTDPQRSLVERYLKGRWAL